MAVYALLKSMGSYQHQLNGELNHSAKQQKKFQKAELHNNIIKH